MPKGSIRNPGTKKTDEARGRDGSGFYKTRSIASKNNERLQYKRQDERWKRAAEKRRKAKMASGKGRGGGGGGGY